MSDPVLESSPNSSARENQAQAAAWLERRHREDWAPEHQIEFDAWLAKSPAHIIAYVRVETAWKRADRLTALRQPAFRRFGKASGRHLLPIVLGVAGALAFASLVGITSLPNFSKPHDLVYATGIGGHKTILLSDGTQIELNTDSIVRVGEGAASREAWLEKGEAYFRITHDAAHPFVVLVGDRRITDLGTKFSVRKDPGRLEVSLVEGRAVFDAPNGTIGTPVILAPGDVVTEHGRSVVVTRKPLDELADKLGWRRGMLIFKHTTLAEAAEQFNRYNTAKIVIADAATAQLTIGGSFQSDNINVFARSMKALLGLHIEKRGSETVLSR